MTQIQTFSSVILVWMQASSSRYV